MSAGSDANTTVNEPDLRGGFFQLLLATFASAVGFWAWMLISPIQRFYAEGMDLSEGQVSLMLATPVLVGAIGRIFTGALTDRFGARKMFTAVLLATIPAVLLVALAGSIGSFALLIIAGTYLGVGGSIFAVGVPFASAWYPANRRGFANGIFGMGMIGTAISAFQTPRLLQDFGYWGTHLFLAGLLLAAAILVWFLMRESPAWKPSSQPLFPKVFGALKLAITWEMSFLYGIVFGGFVAFSTFLPKYLMTIYPENVDPIGAGTRTALFAVAAVIARPVGGVLADKFGPKVIALISLAGIVSLAYIVGQQPAEGILTGVTFILMASAMGLGMGAVFAWIGPSTPPEKVGAVSGVVAAAGGLGGYFPPLAMGATYHAESNSYALGLWLLVLVGTFALVVAGMLRGTRARDGK
ncbi:MULTISPECIES: MFS transporter [Glutamicibacter]|uniref:MFS transporter n=1 Tax=Glutamicibacter nicotianae TaxID=37929 RepID=A0ABQ0RPJ9_GLUNI|nr:MULTISPECIES: MFS transporter [Glutamicibacter]QEP06147.1 NarK/NasA family nitrate transporter [Glutamicibacter sp. ZJUTW]WIV44474.1 MFS transporter [Glutamicibacter nicotianae]GEC13748.1 MFS transporter [Glutamicibacter nicotianae]